MELDPKRLSNWMLITVLVLIISATAGVFVASIIFSGTAVASAMALGPAAFFTTVPMAMAFAAMVNLLIFVVPFWGLIGGWLFAQGIAAQFRGKGGPLGTTLFSETHPIHLRVNEFAQQLELPPIKWVGWFDDSSINAYAMGMSQQQAVVGFSRGAIEKLSREELDAVIGHELAHVANKDMHRMTYAYGIQRSLTWFLVLRSLKQFARWVFTPISELEIMRFSRQREYWADAIGAALTSRKAMANALLKIKNDSAKPWRRGDQYAHFMFNAQANSFLSTHPTISQRVNALEKATYVKQLPTRQRVAEVLAAAE